RQRRSMKRVKRLLRAVCSLHDAGERRHRLDSTAVVRESVWNMENTQGRNAINKATLRFSCAGKAVSRAANSANSRDNCSSLRMRILADASDSSAERK